MFVAAEFQSMRRLCLPDLENLLKKLSIPIPDWNGDEYRIYEKLDNEITKKICALMKSSSIFEGYTNFLKLSGISYDYSETDNELLDKIIANGNKILDSVRKNNEEYELWQAQWGSVSPAPERKEILSVNAFDMNPFDKDKLISEFKDIRKSFPKLNWSAQKAVDECIDRVENLFNLFELNSQILVEDISDISELLRKISMPLHDVKERIICLKLKKRVQFTEKKIPPAPSKSAFSVQEVEDALKILIQVNEIIKKI